MPGGQAASGLRRLFSTFARGWPGVGLLLLRLIATAALMNQAALEFQLGTSTRPAILALLTVATAILLLLGLWTPIAGVLAVTVELWAGFREPGDHWIHILLGALGVGLGLLGPGVWSVDARLFGWKRVEPRKS